MSESADADSLSFTNDGAELYAKAAAPWIAPLGEILAELPQDQAGVRITGVAKLTTLLANDGAIGGIAAKILGENCRAVRAIFFDKSPQTNWSLGWHQDRTICVKRRVEFEGFGPWTMKAGLQHVAPPFDLLARMVTLRIHLDRVSADNAPLLVAPGSHSRGRIAVSEVDAVVRQHGIRQCLAEIGDVWLYATPILHASNRSIEPTHRRVLQIDFSADELPGGLEWLGI